MVVRQSGGVRPGPDQRGEGARPEPAGEDPRRHATRCPASAPRSTWTSSPTSCSRASARVKPAVKFRYLKAGFEIVGDHEQAAEAKKVFDYYKDLVSEIKLETVIDGSTVVGHTRPFGVFVFLRHTREIERESGGFGRYLQNQNSTNTMFSYNYGRPTADYRDRFQSAATEALKEHFEVLSVTFETDKVHSRAAKEYGWRITPYAYLLAQAARAAGGQAAAVAPRSRFPRHVRLRRPAGRVAGRAAGRETRSTASRVQRGSCKSRKSSTNGRRHRAS